jgi:hypothetical protein
MLRTASALTLLTVLCLAAPATAQVGQPLGPWDGQNPFNCVNQDVGTGTDFPHPHADPFCVEFDKTNQNVTDFGIVDFLSKEPARTGIAATKCFYFQQDHWTGSVVQGQDPEIWHWDGRYFFDEAKGIGGVAVHNFRIGGQPADFTPYVPAAYRPYVYPGGGGGVIVTQESNPNPQCAKKVDTPRERRAVYGSAPRYPGCIAPGGRLRGRHVGRVRLGEPRKKLWSRLGKPRRTKHRVDRWCLVGAASVRTGYRSRQTSHGEGHASRVTTIVSTSRGHTIHGVGRGTKTATAKRELNLRPRFKLAAARVLEAPRNPKRRAFVGLHHGRVRWVALADPHELSTHGIRTALHRSL